MLDLLSKYWTLQVHSHDNKGHHYISHDCIGHAYIGHTSLQVNTCSRNCATTHSQDRCSSTVYTYMQRCENAQVMRSCSETSCPRDPSMSRQSRSSCRTGPLWTRLYSYGLYSYGPYDYDIEILRARLYGLTPLRNLSMGPLFFISGAGTLSASVLQVWPRPCHCS